MLKSHTQEVPFPKIKAVTKASTKKSVQCPQTAPNASARLDRETK